MDPCSYCGAAHAPAAAGEPCLAACVRSLAERLRAVEPALPLPGGAVQPPIPVTVVNLGGSAGGSGGLK